MLKKLLSFLLILLLLLAGCNRSAPAPESSVPETTVPVTVSITVPTTEALPEHSELYIPDLSQEDVIRYFNEVCLDAEFTNSGDPSYLQKWAVPICYWVYGEPTAEDIAVLSDFRDWLNTLEGFPGMAEAENEWTANLRIHFCTQEEMLTLMGENFTGMDGAVTFWYDNDEIYDAIICIRTDLTQELRNSVLLEELYNGLGPIQDTSLREDSIIYAGYSEPQELTEVDRLLLRLLYHPALQCGMTAAECETAIRELYY